MIELKTDNDQCRVSVDGTARELFGEAITAFIAISRILAESTGRDEDSLMLMIYEAARETIEKNEVEDSNESKNN